MCLDKIPGEHLIGTNTAVVWALWWGEATWGPSEGPQVRVKQDVLLLNAKPWLIILAPIICLLALDAMVSLCGKDRINLLSKICRQSGGSESEHDLKYVACGLHYIFGTVTADPCTMW